MQDGLIVGRGKGPESYLMFNEQLGDFELKFSYKFISDEGNTGVEVGVTSKKEKLVVCMVIMQILGMLVLVIKYWAHGIFMKITVVII